MILAVCKNKKKDNVKIKRAVSYMPYAQHLMAFLKRAVRTALQKA